MTDVLMLSRYNITSQTTKSRPGYDYAIYLYATETVWPTPSALPHGRAAWLGGFMSVNSSMVRLYCSLLYMGQQHFGPMYRVIALYFTIELSSSPESLSLGGERVVSEQPLTFPVNSGKLKPMRITQLHTRHV